ncbi:MAG: Glycosyl transferase family 2 [Desulfotomaculum sp. 46_296]|nr:MAG: Glycosyl transferase family 2 [Desulfotomaculum sp. 46_296]HAU32588.1 glycosyltransferase family 2 protein [Desulfotomaculum sp.]
METRVAVVIPCFNYGKYIEEAVQSVLNQDIKTEMLILDDGSTESGTIRVLDHLRKRGLVIYRHPNTGLPGARNSGIEKTSSEFIVCLDADDIIEPSYCSSCLNVLLSRPEVGFVYTGTKVFGKKNKLWSNVSYSCLHLLVENYIPSSAMFRRKIWLDAGGFSEEMRTGYEDWDFWLSAAEAGWRGYHVPELLFNYRKHDCNMLQSSNALRKELKRILRLRHRKSYSLSNILNLAVSELPALPRVSLAALKQLIKYGS